MTSSSSLTWSYLLRSTHYQTTHDAFFSAYPLLPLFWVQRFSSKPSAYVLISCFTPTKNSRKNCYARILYYYYFIPQPLLIHYSLYHSTTDTIKYNLPQRNEMTYLSKQQELVATYITPMCGTMLQLVQTVDELSHKLYTDNYLSSWTLCDDFYKSNITCCGIVHYNRKSMASSFKTKYLKGVFSQDKWKVYQLIKFQTLLVEGNLTGCKYCELSGYWQLSYPYTLCRKCNRALCTMPCTIFTQCTLKWFCMFLLLTGTSIAQLV